MVTLSTDCLGLRRVCGNRSLDKFPLALNWAIGKEQNKTLERKDQVVTVACAAEERGPSSQTRAVPLQGIPNSQRDLSPTQKLF